MKIVTIVPVESTRCSLDVLLDGLGIRHRCLDDGRIEVREHELPAIVPYDLSAYFDHVRDPSKPGVIYLTRKTTPPDNARSFQACPNRQAYFLPADAAKVLN